MAQLLMPLSTLRVSNVRDVYIHTPPVKRRHTPQTPQAPTAIIAEKCPKVTTLHIDGFFMAETITPFTSCQTLKVTSDSVWVGAGIDTDGNQNVLQLHLLPHSITTLEIAPAPLCPLVILDHQDTAKSAAEADAADAACSTPKQLKLLSPFCSQLSGHQSLTVLLLADSCVRSVDWDRFPASLQEIQCGFEEVIVSDNSLPSLQKATIHSHSFMYPLALATLVSVLQLAPSLKTVKFAKPRGAKYRSEADSVYLMVPCMDTHVPELQFLKMRITDGGLELVGGVHLLVVSTKGVADGEGGEHVGEFLDKIPLGMPCVSLLLESSPADTEITFLPKQLETRVPGLTTLGILSNLPVDTEDLSCLVKFTALTHLSLATRLDDDYDAVPLTLLCTRLPSLLVLRLQDNGSGMDVRVQQKQAVLQQWNSPVALSVYRDKRIILDDEQ